MTVVRILPLVFVLACSNNNQSSVDAVAVAHDAPIDAPACSQHTLFLNAGGGAYTTGADDARANTSLLVSGTVAPYAGSDLAAVTACVTAALASYSITVTTTDPGSAPHQEIALTTTIPGFTSSYGAAAVTCSSNANAVGFVSGTKSGANVCAVALNIFGLLNGLEYTTDAHDFMDDNTCTGATCSFADTAEPCVGVTAPGTCQCGGGTTEDPATRLHAALCPGP